VPSTRSVLGPYPGLGRLPDEGAGLASSVADRVISLERSRMEFTEEEFALLDLLVEDKSAFRCGTPEMKGSRL
jgi:hypothetical protein